MGNYDPDYRRYKLYGIDSSGKKVVLFEATSIEKVDEFTKQFINKDDLLIQLSERYEINFLDFYIESRGQKQADNEQGKIIKNIVYMDDKIPSLGELQDIYINYLLEDRNRIKYSFGHYKPRFMSDEGINVESYRLASSVRAKISSYMNVREVYFELVKNGKIKSKRNDFDYVKDLKKLDKKNKEIDFFEQLLNIINSDYSEVEPEKMTSEDVRMISDSIMVDKIRNGEVEPFEYFDLEDYVSMSSKKGRGR